ncbi:hypothetical protein ABIA99_003495 [Bradyrhizobium sp. LB12.1]|uniref:TniQ family protein n=1 Tax=Bradyrhizobium sp. LB12.1 TaxID=3156327 RepID=UPI00339AF596
MKPLRQTLPLGVGETPASFVSRLGAMRRLPAREFCLDLGITFQKVVDGDPEALAVVALKAGVDPATLNRNAFAKIGDRLHDFRGQRLVRGSLRRATVVVCPECLIEDTEAAPHLRPGIAPFQRAIWQIGAVKTCHIHKIALATVTQDVTPSKMHDWMHHIEAILPDLPRLAASAETRPPTGFEIYVLARATGGLRAYDLLDSWPLHVAIGTCEFVGAVAAFSRTVNMKTMSDDDWCVAGAAGFDILSEGVDGLSKFLLRLQQTYSYSGGATEGAQAIFGRLYQALEFGREEPGYDPVRDLVGDFIRTHFPVGPGDAVFGKPVEKRVLHSIRTLSIQTGAHPKRLRKILKAAGVLPSDADELADGNCLFDAERGSLSATEASAATLSVRKAGEYLNAPRVQRDRLYQHGLIIPRIRAGDHGAADKFAPEDLDAFLARLLGDAVPVDAVAVGQATIAEAAKAAFVMSEVVVRLVMDGQLTRKWRLTTERGYLALLLDIAEVQAATRGPDHGGLTGLQIKDRLSTGANVVAALIKHGHLKSETVINPINRCPTIVVMPSEVDRFDGEFVSLFAVARKRDLHHMKVKKALDGAGVQPALDPETLKATFYRRSDISNVRIPTAQKGTSR